MALSMEKRIAFDAHNHIHLSTPDGIPPLLSLTDTLDDSSTKSSECVKEHLTGVIDALHLQILPLLPEENETSEESNTKGGSITVGGLALMSTQPRDFNYVEELSKSIKLRSKSKELQLQVIPCYGVHPWFLRQANEDFETFIEDCNPTSILDLNIPSPVENEAQLPRPCPSELSEITDVATTTPWLSYLQSKINSDPKSQVGEIGLDGARYDPITKDLVSPMSHQIQAFEVQMHLAADLGKCVSVHAVRAWGPLMDSMRNIKSKRNSVKKERKILLKAFQRERRETHNIDGSTSTSTSTSTSSGIANSYATLPPRIYFHAFGGKAAIVDQLDAICRDAAETFYGFAPVVNFRSPKTASIIKKIGIGRLVLETDLEDYNGVMNNLHENVKFISEALEMDENEVIHRTTQNAKRLYEIKG